MFMKYFLSIIAASIILFNQVNAENHEYVKSFMDKYRNGHLFHSYNIPIKTQINSLLTYPNSQSHDIFCFIGDTGGGGKQQRDAASLLVYHSQQNIKDHCDQTHLLGDIIYPVGIQEADGGKRVKELFFDIYKNLLGPNRPPIYLAFGNHDYYGSVEKWFEYAANYPNLKIPYYFYAEKINDLCLVTIDTNPIYEQGWHSKDIPRYHQHMEWYKRIHPQLSACRFKVLLGHHPHISARESDKALKIFYEKYIEGKFDLIISGHDHLLSYMGARNGTHMFVSGGGGKEIREKAKNEAIEAKKKGIIKWVSFNPGILKMKVHRQSGALKKVDIYSIIQTNVGAKVEKRVSLFPRR